MCRGCTILASGWQKLFVGKLITPDMDEEFEVESIKDCRVHGGVIEYLVNWKGYSEAEATWEPVGNLDCAEKVSEFHNRRHRIQAKRWRHFQRRLKDLIPQPPPPDPPLASLADRLRHGPYAAARHLGPKRPPSFD
jgi:hypothetical protein